ncbi:MAG: hypothetical protein R3F62_13915 [Planctomycetota bacterium]
MHSAFASTDNDVFYALFSPDGTKVAYSADPNVNSKIEVFAVDVSGGTPGTVRTATPSGAIDEMNAQTTFMVWSPDSTYLCYRADALVDGRFDVYAVDASNLGASLSPFLLHTVQSGRSSSSNMLWSSDSTKTLFSAIYGTESTSTELYFATVALAPQAPAAMRVSQAFPSSRSVSATFSRQSESVAVTQPILSSDDALLFYRADADVDNEFEIYVVDVSGSFTTPQQVNGTLQSGTSADFTYLLLGSATRQLVYIAQEDAGTPEQLILATLPTPTNSGPSPARPSAPRTPRSSACSSRTTEAASRSGLPKRERMPTAKAAKDAMAPPLQSCLHDRSLVARQG